MAVDMARDDLRYLGTTGWLRDIVFFVPNLVRRKASAIGNNCLFAMHVSRFYKVGRNNLNFVVLLVDRHQPPAIRNDADRRRSEVSHRFEFRLTNHLADWLNFFDLLKKSLERRGSETSLSDFALLANSTYDMSTCLSSGIS